MRLYWISIFSALITKTPLNIYGKFHEYIIYNHLGEECQRFIIYLGKPGSVDVAKGHYHQQSDELILVHQYHIMFYIIPSNRNMAKLMWHEFNVYERATTVLIGSGKIWLVGGYKGEHINENFTSIETYLGSNIYDMK